MSRLLIVVAGLICIVGCRPENTTKPPNTGSQTDAPPQTESAQKSNTDHGDPANTAARGKITKAIRSGDFETAERIATAALVADPNDNSLHIHAAKVANQTGHPNAAFRFYQSAVDAVRRPSQELLDQTARTAMTIGRPFVAVDNLRTMVKIYDSDPKVRADIAGLLAGLGLEDEAATHLQWLVQRGFGGVGELTILTDLTRPQIDIELCQDALQRFPADQRPAYALAKSQMYEQEWDAAAKQLGDVTKQHPKFAPAWACLARCLVELNRADELQSRLQQMPDSVKQHPQFWIAAGLQAGSQGQTDAAADAFANAARLNENNGEVLSRLSTALALAGRNEQAAKASARAVDLSKLRDAVDTLFSWRNNSQRACVEIALVLQRLGRSWEAATWLRMGSMMTTDPDKRLKETFAKIRGGMSADTPWQDPNNLVTTAMKIDFDLQWQITGQIGHPDLVRNNQSKNNIRIVDEANKRGVDYTCLIGMPPGKEGGMMIYQSGSGGAGVLDFDLNGFPDLYLTSADGTPRQSDSSANGLFQNHDGQFQDVSSAAHAVETGFSQGVACGDVNSDGFPDIYVANIGINQVHLNNGDGTFTIAETPAFKPHRQWTSSVAIADLDGDGLADLFDVGYCSGQSVFTKPCLDAKLDEPRTCQPLAFAAQRDSVFQSDPTGGFRDVTESWLGAADQGHGLGILVGRLHSDTSLDVYVANDMTTNNYWAKDPQAADPSTFKLSDQAAVRGLAFNARSLSQASMGIAAGDPDNDGDTDLFLTHFTDDHNTFYQCLSPGIWADQSTPSGLAAPSISKLGFGTQWIDFDHDGSPELIVANGHVDDFTHEGLAFRMPAQLFDSNTSNKWFEVDGKSVGEAFTTPRLGRALASLDADRDGKCDAVMTYLYDPVALLMNKTDVDTALTTLFLSGTTVARDPIGAKVKLVAGDQLLYAQLYAGDGYQSSNQRCVRFAVDANAKIDRIEVNWPNGHTETFTGTDNESIKPGREYRVVEGTTTVFQLN